MENSMKYLFLLMLLFSLFDRICASEGGAELCTPKVRLAISTLAEPSTSQPLISMTITALKKEFGPDHVEVNVYQLKDLERVIRRGDADVFIYSSGTFRRFAD